MEFLETAVFSHAADKLLSDEERRQLQNLLLRSPFAGALIRNSGAFARSGSGPGAAGNEAVYGSSTILTSAMGSSSSC